jgi:hypothetical protein
MQVFKGLAKVQAYSLAALVLTISHSGGMTEIKETHFTQAYAQRKLCFIVDHAHATCAGTSNAQ